MCTTQTTERIVELDKRYEFEKIYVDDGGIGFGVFSELLKEDSTRAKTIPLNNAPRPLDYKDEKKKKNYNKLDNTLSKLGTVS